jgi:hypothetical protein
VHGDLPQATAGKPSGRDFVAGCLPIICSEDVEMLSGLTVSRGIDIRIHGVFDLHGEPSTD